MAEQKPVVPSLETSNQGQQTVGPVVPSLEQTPIEIDPKAAFNTALISSTSLNEVELLYGMLNSPEGEAQLRSQAQQQRFEALAKIVRDNPGVDSTLLLSDATPLSFEKNVVLSHAKTPTSALNTHANAVFLRMGKDLQRLLKLEGEDDWIDYGVDSMDAFFNAIVPFWENAKLANVYEGNTGGYFWDPGEAFRLQMLKLLDPSLQGEEWEFEYQRFLDNVKDASSSLRDQNPNAAAEILSSVMMFGRDRQYDWVFDALVFVEGAAAIKVAKKSNAISKGITPADTVASLGNRGHAANVAASTNNVADSVPSFAKTGVQPTDGAPDTVGLTGDIPSVVVGRNEVDIPSGNLGPVNEVDIPSDIRFGPSNQVDIPSGNLGPVNEVDIPSDIRFGPSNQVDIPSDIRFGPSNQVDVPSGSSGRNSGLSAMVSAARRPNSTSVPSNQPTGTPQPIPNMTQGTSVSSRTLVDDFNDQFSRLDALAPEDRQKAIDAVVDDFRVSVTSDIKDQVYNPKTGELDLIVGRKVGQGGFKDGKTAKAQLKKRFPSFEFSVFEGNDGLWYGRFRRDTKTTGLKIDEIGQENLKGTLFSKWVVGAASQMTESLRQVLRGTQNRAPKVQKAVQKKIDSINRLSREQQGAMENVAEWVRDHTSMKEKLRVWEDNRQYYLKFSDINGRPPSKEEMKAWSSYKEVMELDYHIRNRERREFLVNQGFIDVHIDTGTAKGRISFVSKPTRRSDVRGASILDPSDGTVKSLDEIPENAKIYKLRDSFTDKTTNNHVGYIVSEKASEGQLRSRVLPYNPGGHRVNKGGYFVKQDRVSHVGDLKIHLSPKTTVIARRQQSAIDFANKMNTLQAAVKQYDEAKITLQELDKIFIENQQEGVASLADWRQLVNNGEIIPDQPFTTVKDGEPIGFINDAENVSFIPEGESMREIWMRQEKGFNASRRKRRLKNEYLEESAALRPLEAMHATLGPTISRGSLLNYRTRSVESWLTAARPHMKNAVRGHGELREFMTAEIKEGSGVKQALEIQRDIIRRNLNMNSDLRGIAEASKDYMITSVLKWSPKDSKKWLGRSLEDIALDTTFSPSQLFKAMAMNLKLGLFDVSQMVVQTQTALAAAAIDPVSWSHAMRDAPLVFASRFFHDDKHLKQLSKLARDPDEFIARHKMMESSGIWDVASNTALLEYSPETMFSSSRFGRNLNSGAETAKFFYYEAERINRTVGYMMAFERHKKRYPNMFSKGHDLSIQMKNSILDEALSLSMDMDRAGQAKWQQGLAGVPTQFMAYQFRFWEKVLAKASGKNALTATERARLGLSQLVYYGAAGVPLASSAFSVLEQKVTMNKEVEDLIGHGIFDALTSWAFGRDVELSKRVGTGSGVDQFVSDIMSNETGFIEAMVGPAGTIGTEVIGETYTAVRNTMRLLGHGEMPSKTDWERVLRNAISVDRYLDAFDVLAYGTVFNDNSGQPLVDRGELSGTDAILVALGIPIGEISSMREQWLSQERQDRTYRNFGNQIMRRINDIETAKIEGREQDVEDYVREVEILMTTMPHDIRERIYDAEPRIGSMLSGMIEKTLNNQTSQANRVERNLEERENQ